MALCTRPWRALAAGGKTCTCGALVVQARSHGPCMPKHTLVLVSRSLCAIKTIVSGTRFERTHVPLGGARRVFGPGHRRARRGARTAPVHPCPALRGTGRRTEIDVGMGDGRWAPQSPEKASQCAPCHVAAGVRRPGAGCHPKRLNLDSCTRGKPPCPAPPACAKPRRIQAQGRQPHAMTHPRATWQPPTKKPAESGLLGQQLLKFGCARRI